MHVEWSSLITLSKDGRLQEHIMLHYWIDWLTESGRNGHIWRRKKSIFMVTMHHLTHRTLHRQKSMKWVSNRFHIHRIFQIWPPATIICFQTSRDGCVVGVLNRRSWMGNKRVFGRVWQIVLFGRHRKVERSLDSLYRAKRRVYWEIKLIFAKKINSCSFYHVNFKNPNITTAWRFRS